MTKHEASKWLTVAVVVVGTLASRACHAQGLYGRDGETSEGVSPGLQYFRNGDEYGWQDEVNGQTYYHSNKRSCSTNTVLGNSRTSCTEW